MLRLTRVSLKVLKGSGGFVWACKNYDGDVQSDVVAQGKFFLLPLSMGYFMSYLCFSLFSSMASFYLRKSLRLKRAITSRVSKKASGE